MNIDDLYNETIVRRGRIYRYDPDFDCYLAVQSLPETHLQRWLWLYMCIAILLYTAYYCLTQ
jgi:hypothetical protein